MGSPCQKIFWRRNRLATKTSCGCTRRITRKLKSGTLSYGEALRMEIPYSKELVEAVWLAAGGSILAGQRALVDGWAANTLIGRTSWAGSSLRCAESGGYCAHSHRNDTGGSGCGWCWLLIRGGTVEARGKGAARGCVAGDGGYFPGWVILRRRGRCRLRLGALARRLARRTRWCDR